MTSRKFVYRVSRTSYEKEWDRNYDRPGVGARFLAFLFRILPKVGPLKALAFKVPTPEAEKLFLVSFDDTTKQYQALLGRADAVQMRLPNENFDIGKPTRRGTYRLADETYDKLLEAFHDQPDQISAELRADILRFYSDGAEPASQNAQWLLSALRAQPATTGPDHTAPSSR